MSDFMKTDMRQPMLFQKVVKTMADIVRRIRLSIVPFEHILVFLVGFSEKLPVFPFGGLCGKEDCPRLIHQGERPETAGVFGLVLFNRL